MASIKKLLVISLFAAALLFSAAPSYASGCSRIISLYAGHTDNIIALGGARRLVGISNNDSPDTLPTLPRFSMKAGAEELLALHPDLVIIRTLVKQQNPGLVDILGRAGVNVVLIDPPKWDSFESYLRELGPMVGSSPEAAVRKLKKLRKNIGIAREPYLKKKKPLVLVEATEKELYTCSPDSWAAHLIELAGGENAAKDASPLRKGSSIASWGLERTMKKLSSGIDVYIVQQGAMNASCKESLERRPWYPALKKTKVALIPEDELSRPSLMGIEKGGRALIKIFYGDVGKK